MIYYNFIAIFLCMICVTPTYAQFQGELILSPNGCQDMGECTLEQELRYTDPNGIVWAAAAGLRTDGASIPSWAQPFVGAPFDEAYLKAAIVHDHYCKRRVRPVLQTHRLFYDAMIELQLDARKAAKMYIAVLIGGPKWIRVVPGQDCGAACIQNVGAPDLLVTRSDLYSTPRFQTEFEAATKLIDAIGAELTPERIEALAKAIRPDDVFLHSPGRVEIDGQIDMMIAPETSVE